MKLLHQPEPCKVLLEPVGAGVRVQAVRYRGVVWTVRVTLEIWVYHSAWWTGAALEGERREYHILGTSHGEITVYQTRGGWFVAGWFD